MCATGEEDSPFSDGVTGINRRTKGNVERKGSVEMNKRNKGITHYSEEWPGSYSNYDWSVQFDVTDGIVGISQMHNKPLAKGEPPLERVLLNRRQIVELIKFVQMKGTKGNERRKIMKTILLTAVLLLLPALALANCWTETTMTSDGRMIICQVCCLPGAGCQRNCF